MQDHNNYRNLKYGTLNWSQGNSFKALGAMNGFLWRAEYTNWKLYVNVLGISAEFCVSLSILVFWSYMVL